jgi:hypothetical protein
LGIAYIAVGGLCIILGAVFTATHLIKPRFVRFTQHATALCTKKANPYRKLGDHTYLSWNNTPAAKSSGPAAVTAMASGREVRPGET